MVDRTVPFVLAFLMVFAIVQSVVPEAEAGHPSAGTAPAGHMRVYVEPAFTGNVIMVKQGISTERVVRVTQGDPAKPMNQVEFVWFMRTDTSDPKCEGTPQDLCSTAVKFDWLVGDGTWDAKGTSYALRPGWKVESITSAAAKILRFTATGGQALVSGTPQDFNIAFSQRGGANLDEYHIQMRGYCGTECQSHVAFETTCASSNGPEFTCILTNPPFTGTGGKAPADCNAPCAGQNPSLKIIIDSDPPGPPTVTMHDIDHNGHIDRFVADFPKKLDPKSFDPRLFTFTARGRTFNSAVTDAGYTIQNAYFANPDNPVRIVFLVHEMPYYDTGDEVTMRYAGTTLRDEAWNAVRAINVKATDKAPPVIVGAYGIEGHDVVPLTFSEPVEAVTLDSLMFFDDGGTDLAKNRIQCPGGPGTSCALNVASGPFKEVKHTAGPRTGHLATIHMNINPGTSTNYVFGSADVHPLTGDMIGVGTNGAPCAPGQEPPCDGKIKDVAGNPMWHPVPQAGIRHISRPLLMRAEVDIGSDALKLTFNGPVRAAKEPTATTPQPLAISNLDIVTAAGTGVGPQGLIGNHFLAVDQDVAILKLDAKARDTDVDATPSSIRPHCRKILGTGLPETNDQAFIPCDNPDLHYEQQPILKGTGTSTFKGRDHETASPGAAFLDDTPPRIVSARTVDSDHNGWIDGLELVMSEPVNDVTFCANANTAPNFCPDSWTPVNSVSPVGLVMMQSLRSTDERSQECLGLYRWETGIVSNDNVGILKAIAVERTPGGETLVSSRDCSERYFGADTGLRMDTGYLPGLTTTGRGLFADLSVPENRMPQYCQLARTGHFHYPDAAATKDCGTLATTKAQYTVAVADGAGPVVMAARTVDTPYVDGNGNVDPRPNANVWGDGRIDGYRLTFSERVKDSSFDARDWHVQPLGGADEPIHDVHGFRSYDLNETLTALRSNDRQLTLLFNPDTVPNTDARPELTYRKDPDSKGMADPIGNPMADFDEFAVVEQDDARPVIVRIEGYVGKESLAIHFSEPVDDGALGKLVSEDFFYHNNDAAANPGGVAGKAVADASGNAVNVVHDPDRVCDNTAADAEGCSRKAIIPLDRKLTASDLQTDRINAEKDTIYEKAPTVPAAQRKSVPNFQHTLAVGADITPPARVSDLRVQTDAVLANSVLLAWTAPADDGLAGGPVSSYVIKVSKTAIDAAVFDALVNPTGLSFEYDPSDKALAPVNGTQTVRVVGLNTTTQYHFAVRALDEARNAGPVSNTVSALTARDATPPTGTLTITSTSHKAGEASPKTQATFSWNSITDAESTVQYRYAITGSPTYQVLAADKTASGTSVTVDIPAEGDWTFHVAAFSGGGATPTAHFSFTRGASELTPDQVATANDRLKDLTEVVRKEMDYEGVTVDLNTVSWTLPPEDTLPGALEAIEIWRLDEGIPTLVTTQPGSYAELQSGNFTDVTQGADEDSRYRVNMVFSRDQRQADPSVESQFKALQNQTPGEIPAWVYVLAGVALALIIAGIIIYFVLRGRQKAAAAGGVAYSWESADPEALGIDEATGLPVHEVKCPSCNNPFQAVGALPLPVTCPTCQTTGMLE